MSQRILVCRLDKVGDAVLSTPFLYNLRRCYPEATIVAAVNAYNQDVWRGNPAINEPLYTPRSPRQVKELGPFDIAIALSPTAPTYQMVAASQAPERWGIVYSRRLGARVTTLFQLTRPTLVDVDGALARNKPVTHEVRQMLAILEGAGCSVENVPCRLFPTDVQQSEAARLLPNGPLLGIHLGVRWFTDGWSVASFLSLTQRLLEEFPDHRLVITHGAAERDMARQLPARQRVQVLGELPFGVWAAALGRCQACVSPDTGALHVAAAMQVPVVGVYEASTFAHCSQQWAPWMVPHGVVAKTTVEQTADVVCRSLGKLVSQARRG